MSAVPPEFPPLDRKRALGSIASDDGQCPDPKLTSVVTMTIGETGVDSDRSRFAQPVMPWLKSSQNIELRA